MRIASFDVLRGAAILAVVQLHYLFLTGAYQFLGLPQTIRTVLGFGWAGVDLFFVLSAYLLTDRLLKTLDRQPSIVSFYERRARRILPLYLALLVTGFALAIVLPVTPATGWLFGSSCPSWAYPLLVQNWCYGLAGATDAHFFAPTWSLAVEEHFYLVLPLFARFGSARTRAIAALVLILISPLIRVGIAAIAGPAAAYLWSIARLDAFAWGIVLATAPHVWSAFHKHIRPGQALLIGVSMAITAAILFPDQEGSHDFRFGMTATALSAALMTYWAVYAKTSMGVIARSLAWLGRRSYSIYLLHMPVLGLVFFSFTDRSPRVETSGDLLLVGASALICGGLSCVTFSIFERRFVSTSVPSGPAVPASC